MVLAIQKGDSMKSLSLDELKSALETAEKTEDNRVKFVCTIEEAPLSLSAHLAYSDTGDCGKGYEYRYVVALYKDKSLVMDTDPLYSADDTHRMFATFAHGLKACFFVGEKMNEGRITMDYETFAQKTKSALQNPDVAFLKAVDGINAYIATRGDAPNKLRLTNYVNGLVAGEFYAETNQIVESMWRLYPDEWESRMTNA
mgnify:CR=1 FL=1